MWTCDWRRNSNGVYDGESEAVCGRVEVCCWMLCGVWGDCVEVAVSEVRGDRATCF